VRGQDVDVELVGADAGIARGHLAEALVPVRHRDRDAVRLGRRREVLRRSPARELERELQDAIDTFAREDRFLEHDLALGAFEHPPPTDEYSPSVFSRTTMKSTSPGFLPASGVGMPGISRQGRRFTY
jgi:hypothetical protein